MERDLTRLIIIILCLNPIAIFLMKPMLSILAVNFANFEIFLKLLLIYKLHL